MKSQPLISFFISFIFINFIPFLFGIDNSDCTKTINDEQIIKTYWKDMENTLTDKITHDKDRETAERLIKMGKLSLEEIGLCVPALSFDELKKLEAEVMQLA